MPYYFMRDTPLQALEQLMMSQPGQKPRGGGIYRSPFHYTPKDVACEYCQNYDRKHPCRLCECTCLEERIEAGVLEMNEFVRDCFAPSIVMKWSAFSPAQALKVPTIRPITDKISSTGKLIPMEYLAPYSSLDKVHLPN